MRIHRLNDRGSVTIEAALALASLVIVAAAIVQAMAAMAAKISSVDVAGAAARAHAVGLDYTPEQGTVTVAENDGLITVTAEIPTAIGTMSSVAIYPVETP